MFGKTEVTEFDLVFLEENVLRFEVPMQDSVLVEVEHRIEDLSAVESDPVIR